MQRAASIFITQAWDPYPCTAPACTVAFPRGDAQAGLRSGWLAVPTNAEQQGKLRWALGILVRYRHPHALPHLACISDQCSTVVPTTGTGTVCSDPHFRDAA